MKQKWSFRLPCFPCHSVCGDDKYHGKHLNRPQQKLLSICPGKGNIEYQLSGICASVEFRQSGFLATRNLNQPSLPPALYALLSFCPSLCFSSFLVFSLFLLFFFFFTFFCLHLCLFLNKPTHLFCHVKLNFWVFFCPF